MRRAADSYQWHARSAGQRRPDTASRPRRGAYRARDHERGTTCASGGHRGRGRVSQARRFDAPRRARNSPFGRGRRCGSGSVLMSPRLSLDCHSTRASRRIPALFWSFALSVFCVAVLLTLSPSAFAWDSHTHKLITRLAVQALPPSPLAQTFTHNELQLEEYSLDPDTVLRSLYGEAEGRRHYVDLEYFGAFPFASLEPNFATMETKFGARTMTMSGTLPW